jgi:hypothetical protein
MAYVGPTDIRFVHRDEIVVRERVSKHGQQIHYRDYLIELSKKPQAVRQVAPELVAEMGEPFAALWLILEKSHGGKTAGRIFARVLDAVVDHGEAAVGQAMKKALAAGKQHLLGLAALTQMSLPDEIDVPEPLKSYVVESARATDFDALMEVTP